MPVTVHLPVAPLDRASSAGLTKSCHRDYTASDDRQTGRLEPHNTEISRAKFPYTRIVLPDSN